MPRSPRGPRRHLLALCLTCLAVLGWSSAASAANSFPVNDPTDAALSPSTSTTCQTATAGHCTLRAAVQAADNAGGASTITVPAGTYKLTIPSTAANDPSNGDLDVKSGASITVTGAGSASTVIDAAGIDRAFAVANGGSLALSGTTIKNGAPAVASSGSRNGGAIYSAGGLSLTGDDILSGNYAAGNGGAVYADSGSGSALSVNGATFTKNTTSGNQGGAIYNATPGAATIAGSTFTGGTTNGGSGGGVYQSSAGDLNIANSAFLSNTADDGGALYVSGASKVTITGSTFTQNSGGYDQGGAIEDGGSASLSISSSRFSGNTGGYGGALYLNSSATGAAYTLTGDSFDANTASGEGGGAIDWRRGTLRITGSSLTHNTAGYGGGIYANQTAGLALSLVNTTISDNTAGLGGGIEFTSSTPATLTNDTIAYNSAGSGQGGGLYQPGDLAVGSGSTGVLNTIIGANSGGDCDVAILAAADAGHNLDSDGSCLKGVGGAGDKVGVDPQLGHAADNGGSVLTDEELAGSPAIDAGTNTGCPATDARGVTRPQGAACDIGAFEAAPAGLTVSNTGPSTVPVNGGYEYTILVSATGNPSTNTNVVDQLPAGVHLFGYKHDRGTCSDNGSVILCQLGTISPGTTDRIDVIVGAPSTGGVAVNKVTATNNQGANVVATARTFVLAPATPPSVGAPTAITGPATHITHTTATLNGTVATGGQVTTWFFQYGTSKRYGSLTWFIRTGASGSVQALIRSLHPATKYHYRLVAINDSRVAYGADRTLTTTGTNGRVRLNGTHLKAAHGKVAVLSLSCQSTIKCAGTYEISAPLRVRGKTRLVSCASGSFALNPGATHTEKAQVSGDCRAAIVAARKYRVDAVLTVRPHTAQRRAVFVVRLEG